eukprot:gene3735-biopygen12821
MHLPEHRISTLRTPRRQLAHPVRFHANAKLNPGWSCLVVWSGLVQSQCNVYYERSHGNCFRMPISNKKTSRCTPALSHQVWTQPGCDESAEVNGQSGRSSPHAPHGRRRGEAGHGARVLHAEEQRVDDRAVLDRELLPLVPRDVTAAVEVGRAEDVEGRDSGLHLGACECAVQLEGDIGGRRVADTCRTGRQSEMQLYLDNGAQ